MSYMWNEFNIKTFPAETMVYRDGTYCADLSTLPCGPIDVKYDLPVHIIYFGEIAGKCELNIDISAPGTKVFLDIHAKNKLPAFFNIFIKNTGENSELRGHVLLENGNELTFDVAAHHEYKNTGILLQTNVFAGQKSTTKLSGATVIKKDCAGCVSDIAFTAMCAPDARIEFIPAQYISSVPESAGHSAAIYTPSPAQIEFLRMSGLTNAEANAAMRESFANKFTLF